jgi:hypothetical protein
MRRDGSTRVPACSPNAGNVADNGARLEDLDSSFPDAGEAETDAGGKTSLLSV